LINILKLLYDFLEFLIGKEFSKEQKQEYLILREIRL
jgi:hypothetical protein